VPVPDVVGMEEQEAKDELEAAGFKVETAPVQGSKQKKGHVSAQSPAGHKSAPVNSTVTLEIET
jgi:serine/threonine-protein kinase